MPVYGGTGTRQKREIDGASLATIIDWWKTQYPDVRATVEFVGPVSKKVKGVKKVEGVVSMFNFGKGLGRVEGVLIALGIPIDYAYPATWKIAMRLSSNKSLSVELAKKLFPDHWMAFVGPRGGGRDGLAEAALLGWFGATRQTR